MGFNIIFSYSKFINYNDFNKIRIIFQPAPIDLKKIFVDENYFSDIGEPLVATGELIFDVGSVVKFLLLKFHFLENVIKNFVYVTFTLEI